MRPEPLPSKTWDVIVVGAGSAGAAVAWGCASRGLSALCVDGRDLREAGARWVNGVPAWAFDAAGLERPEPPERLAEGVRFHLLSGTGPERVLIEDHDLMEVDMRALVARAQGLATQAGATLRGGVRALGFDGQRLETSIGALRARTFVDASGLHGARLLDSARVSREQLCAAAQQLRGVRDLQAATRYFEAHGVAPGETLCFTGVAGGYSIINLRLDGDHLGVLTGSIPALGHPSGVVMAQDFAEHHPWVGEVIYGGARAVPLRRPYTEVGRGQVAAVGDAACQVHSAHGSGIAQGLIAARLLAECLGSGGGPEDYNLTWQRRWGGQLASAAVFSRFSQQLDPESTRRLVRSGAMGARLSRAVLTQRSPVGGALDLPRAALALARNPDLGRRLLPVVSRMGQVQAHYALYPASPRRRASWEAKLERLMGA